MRAFFALIIFFLAFALFMNTVVAEVDLTPSVNASTQGQAPEVVSTVAAQTQAVQGPEIPVTSSQDAFILPVTGGCSDPYTVRSGDTLSKIAVNCNTTLAFLTQVNPQMSNVELYVPRTADQHSQW